MSLGTPFPILIFLSYRFNNYDYYNTDRTTIKRIKTKENLSAEDVLYMFWGETSLLGGFYGIDRSRQLIEAYETNPDIGEYVLKLWLYNSENRGKRPNCFWLWEGHSIKKKRRESDLDYLERNNLLTKDEKFYLLGES